MPSERIQRRIERMLDEADEAVGHKDWVAVHENAQAVLALDPDNADARTYLAAVERAQAPDFEPPPPSPPPAQRVTGKSETATLPPPPTSFASGRYEVKRFLGE